MFVSVLIYTIVIYGTRMKNLKSKHTCMHIDIKAISWPVYAVHGLLNAYTSVEDVKI